SFGPRTACPSWDSAIDRAGPETGRYLTAPGKQYSCSKSRPACANGSCSAAWADSRLGALPPEVGASGAGGEGKGAPVGGEARWGLPGPLEVGVEEPPLQEGAPVALVGFWNWLRRL